ncbi:MAG: hypothetical protein KA319_01745 [Ferruginibacter sp.]|nr:hypothetical protein [Ferruginibacter sp.]
MKIFSPLISLLLTSSFIVAQTKPIGLGLQLFKNIEQVEYCVLLPLKEFKELPASQRGSHSFVHNKNKKVTIEVAGYTMLDSIITIDSVYARYMGEPHEEVGKIITQIELLKNRKCFYSIGYYNNFLGKYEFIETTWVKNDEVITMQVHYPIKEKKLWYERLKLIIKNAYCR